MISLPTNIIVKGMHHALSISGSSLGCPSNHTVKIRTKANNTMLMPAPSEPDSMPCEWAAPDEGLER